LFNFYEPGNKTLEDFWEKDNQSLAKLIYKAETAHPKSLTQ
jgi:hypothetical protein